MKNQEIQEISNFEEHKIDNYIMITSAGYKCWFNLSLNLIINFTVHATVATINYCYFIIDLPFELVIYKGTFVRKNHFNISATKLQGS